MNETLIDKLAFLEIKNRKLLVTMSQGKDTWYIPGGKRESNETDLEALAREVKEELSVDIVPETAELYGIFEGQAHGRPEGTIVRMTCYMAQYQGELQPAAEIAKMDWFEYAKKGLCAPVDNLIFDDLKQKGLVD